MKHCVTQKHLRGQMITNDKKKPEKSPIEEPLDKDKPFVCPHCNKFYKFDRVYLVIKRHVLKPAYY